MSERKDGGPAFGLPDYVSARRGATSGMSIRDWFAAQAVAGVMAQMDTLPGDLIAAAAADPDKFEAAVGASIARRAYRIADAMLAERNRQPESET